MRLRSNDNPNNKTTFQIVYNQIFSKQTAQTGISGALASASILTAYVPLENLKTRLVEEMRTSKKTISPIKLPRNIIKNEGFLNGLLIPGLKDNFFKLGVRGVPRSWCLLATQDCSIPTKIAMSILVDTPMMNYFERRATFEGGKDKIRVTNYLKGKGPVQWVKFHSIGAYATATKYGAFWSMFHLTDRRISEWYREGKN